MSSPNLGEKWTRIIIKNNLTLLVVIILFKTFSTYVRLSYIYKPNINLYSNKFWNKLNLHSILKANIVIKSWNFNYFGYIIWVHIVSFWENIVLQN